MKYQIENTNKSEELVEMLDLKDVINQQVRKLSLGQRMKCELVAALIHTPKVLFLDEPTIGLDVVMQKKVREFIKEYNERYNATIILTSHYMDDVKELCRRVIMIDKGKILFDGALNDLIKKYADYKILAPIFAKDVPEAKLQEIGEVIEYIPPKAIIKVPREQTSQKASELLAKFQVEDLEITEPPLEDIISLAFTTK
jgi:ABC-2 type transport system ATP-binding protein